MCDKDVLGLDAAVVEFSEHGFSGARISAIAARAGVNQQLISYYFDGKEGLYRALQDRWRVISADTSQALRLWRVTSLISSSTGAPITA